MAIQFLNTGYFPDNAKLTFGDATTPDLEIYHDASHSRIDEVGTGGLIIRTGDFYLRNPSDADMIYAASGGAVKLYYNNVVKFETLNTGSWFAGNLYCNSGSKIHFDNGSTNDYYIEKSSTALTFNTGGTYTFNTGDATFEGKVIIPTRLEHSGDTDTYFGFSANNHFELVAGGTEFLSTDGVNLSFPNGTATFADDILTNTDSSSDIGKTGERWANIWVDSINGGAVVSGSYLPLAGGTMTGDIAASQSVFNITNDDIRLKTSGSETMLRAVANGAVELMYNNSTKIATTNTGISVTGNINTSTDSSVFTGDGSTGVPLFLRSTSSVSYLQIQNSSTGTTGTNDGLTVGCNGTAGYIWLREAASLTIGTNDTSAITIDSSQNSTFAGLLYLPDGSVSAPSISNTGDTNTGMYWPGDHQVGFAVNGSRKFYMSETKTYFQNQANGVEINNGITLINGALSISGDTSNATTFTESGGGDFTIATVDDLRLDSGGNDIVLRGASSAEFGRLTNSSQDFVIRNITGDKDIVFKGVDDTTTITALTLDMSDAGYATFNSGIAATNTSFSGTVNIASYIYHIGDPSTDTYFGFPSNDNFVVYTAGGAGLSIDSNRDVTFTGSLTIPEYINHAGDGNTTFGFGGADDFRVTVGGTKRLNVYTGGIEAVGSLSITGDGSNATTLTESGTGDFTIDAVGDIKFDADGGDWYFKDAGSNILVLTAGGSSSPTFAASQQDADIIFTGNDGGSIITALTIDMSDAGTAIFNNHVSIPDYITHYQDASTRFGFSGSSTYIVNTGGTTALTIDSSQDATFAGDVSAVTLTLSSKGTSAATIAGDGSTTLTTKGYVDSLITGATLYQGTWDPDVSLNSGYGSPNLSTTALQVNGYYYICSADGVAEPNGPATEPNSWHTGDWVIWNDDVGVSGEWQKIDNTSVISGAGTAGRVAKWDGSGTSETLTNSGIQDSSDAVAITINGNEEVGIGTPTPLVILHTQTSADNVGRFESTDATAYIQINDTADSFYIATGTQYGSIGGNASVHVDNLNISLTTGYVGIGTISPDAKLSVTSTGTNSEDILYLKSGIDNADEYLGIAFETGGGGNGPHGAIRVYNGPSSSDAYMSLLTTTDGGTLTQGLTQDHLGNIGIGTTTPGEKLEVDGIIKTVHTDNTYTKLKGTGLYFNRSNSYLIAENDNSLTLNIGADGARWAHTRINSATVKFENGATEYMRITSSGDVGIGTTTPDAKLEVVGGIIAGGKTTYTISSGSLTTTGTAVAGLSGESGGNGQSAGFIFTCFGGDGYQRIVYSCKNVGGTWDINKDIDEGVNAFDVTYAADGSDNITFTFKARSSTQSYTPKVTVEAIGSYINQSYIN